MKQLVTRTTAADRARKRFHARNMLADLAAERKAAVRDIIGRNNGQQFVALRVEFIKRARAMGLSCVQIGKVLKRDHSTVLYHLRGGRVRRGAWYTSSAARAEAAAHAQ